MDWRFYVDGKLHPATCELCGRKIDNQFINPNFKLRKKNMSLSITYDGYFIASERFKQFIEKKDLGKTIFNELPSVNGYYQFCTDSILKFDTNNPYLQLEDFCEVCKSYSTVASAATIIENVYKPLDIGIYRTDLELGTSHEQAPILITDIHTADKIKKSFKDIDFDDLYSKDVIQ